MELERRIERLATDWTDLHTLRAAVKPMLAHPDELIQTVRRLVQAGRLEEQGKWQGPFLVRAVPASVGGGGSGRSRLGQSKDAAGGR